MSWIDLYTFVSKPEWQDISPDAALRMSAKAGSRGKYGHLWSRVLRAGRSELRHGLPRLVPDEPTIDSGSYYYIPASQIVPGISVIVFYAILPTKRHVEVRLKIVTDNEMRVWQQQHPVKIWVMPNTANDVVQDMPTTLPVSKPDEENSNAQ